MVRDRAVVRPHNMHSPAMSLQAPAALGILQPRGQVGSDDPARVCTKDNGHAQGYNHVWSHSGFRSHLSQAGMGGTCRAAPAEAPVGSGSPQPTFPWWPLQCGCPRRLEDPGASPCAQGFPERPMRALLPAEDMGPPHTCPHHISTRFLLQTLVSAHRPGRGPAHPGHCLGAHRV